MQLYKLALAVALVFTSTAHAQLIDTAPTPTATQSGSNRGASVVIETDTQVFITRLDAEITVIVPTEAKFVIWNATTGLIIHQTSTLALGITGRQFIQSPALAFNATPGSRYVLALMTNNIGSIEWHTDTAAENQNYIRTLQRGAIQTTFAAPNEPPQQTSASYDARFRIHGFILNDYDNDNVANEDDNCPFETNPNQADADMDGVGDACDSSTNDADGDTVVNANDNCPFVNNPDQADADMDGIGDACDKVNDNDVDGDGDANSSDNCPFHENPDQKDSDMDGVGDVCDGGSGAGDSDPDGDGVPNESDNCPFSANPSQNDADGDGRGDECDLQIIVDGSGCATTNGGSLLFALLALGLVLQQRRRK